MTTVALLEGGQADSLWREYARTRDEGLRNMLVVRNLPLVHSIARRLAHTSHEPVEDLVQEGSIALIRAVERFAPDRGTRFSTYAFPIVRGAMRNYLSRKAPSRFLALHLEQPTAPEDLDRLRTQDGADFTLAVVDRVATQALLNRLPPPQRRIIMHFFYDDLTQREISSALARSSARISRLLRSALERLKQALLELEQETGAADSASLGSLVDRSTGLFTQTYLERCLGREISRFREGRGRSCLALFRVALARYSDANAGSSEEMLRHIAQQVKERVRVCDHVFRLGSAEIAVLFQGSAERAQRACDRIAARVSQAAGAPTAAGICQPGRDGREAGALISVARAAALKPR